MKANLLISIISLVLFSCAQPATNQDTLSSEPINEEAEKTAILKTIEQETAAFFARDYEAWKKCFLQKDYAFQGWNNKDGSFDASVGWNNIDTRIGDYIKANPLQQVASSHPEVLRKNMTVHFFSDKLAYLVWDQYNSDTEKKSFYHSREQRIMEKQDGAWKILNVTSFWNNTNMIAADSIL